MSNLFCVVCKKSKQSTCFFKHRRYVEDICVDCANSKLLNLKIKNKWQPFKKEGFQCFSCKNVKTILDMKYDYTKLDLSAGKCLDCVSSECMNSALNLYLILAKKLNLLRVEISDNVSTLIPEIQKQCPDEFEVIGVIDGSSVRVFKMLCGKLLRYNRSDTWFENTEEVVKEFYKISEMSAKR